MCRADLQEQLNRRIFRRFINIRNDEVYKLHFHADHLVAQLVATLSALRCTDVHLNVIIKGVTTLCTAFARFGAHAAGICVQARASQQKIDA